MVSDLWKAFERLVDVALVDIVDTVAEWLLRNKELHRHHEKREDHNIRLARTSSFSGRRNGARWKRLVTDKEDLRCRYGCNSGGFRPNTALADGKR